MSVSIKPLEDRIVIQQLEAETTTASGLVLPDTAKEKPQEGKVLAVGPGRVDDNGSRVPVDVKVGDVVIYSKYGGTEIKYGADEYIILSSRDVLAVVEKCRRVNATRRRTRRGAAPPEGTPPLFPHARPGPEGCSRHPAGGRCHG